jgi:hypothetical protein
VLNFIGTRPNVEPAGTAKQHATFSGIDPIHQPRYTFAMKDISARQAGLALLTATSLLLSGCLLSSDHESRGVNLSDAMNASASGDRSDLGGQRSNYHYEDSGTASSDSDSGSSGGVDAEFVTYDKHEYAWQIPVDIRYEVPFSGDFERLTHITLTPIAFESEEAFLGLYLGGARVDFESGSLPDQATDSAWMAEAGLALRLYLNSSRNGLSPYVGCSVGYQVLVWDYRNPIFVGGDVIDSDYLSGIEGTLVLGVSTRRDSHFSVFGEVGVGATVFLCETGQGFENDVFDDFGFVSVKAGVSFKF